MRRFALALAVTLSLAGCDMPSGETSAAVAAGADAVVHTIQAARPVRIAFDVLGGLPEFRPGTSRAAYLEEARDALEGWFGCALLSTQSSTVDDTLIFDFPGSGCVLGAHVLRGQMRFVVTGGGDCLDLQADLTKTFLDDKPIGASVSHGTCESAQGWSARAQGTLKNGYSYYLDARVQFFEEENPISERPTLTLHGMIRLDTSEGPYLIHADRFSYTIGDLSPHHGSVLMLAPGHLVSATFERKTGFPFDRTEAEISIDGHDAVTVPLP